MSGLDIRVYNVGFGDSSLMTWREESSNEEKNVLIDFGNAPNLKDEPYYSLTLDDIKKVTKGKLDLLVCTHQHKDHFGGIVSKMREFEKFEIKKLLMPYIEPVSKSRLHTVRKLIHSMVHSKLGTHEVFREHLITRDELARKDPEKIEDEWEAITSLVKKKNVHFFHRKSEGITKLIRELGFKKMKFEILGPEQNTGLYLASAEDWIKKLASFHLISTGVFPKSLLKLNVMHRHYDNNEILPIDEIGNLNPELFKEFIIKNGDISDYADKVVNNTSLVLRFSYEGESKRTFLLFPGDSEFESWQKIFEAYKRNEHSISSQFLKVSHHGSHDATSDKIAKHIFGEHPKKENTAVVSTLSGVYGKKNEVPSREVLRILQRYSTVHSTEKKKPGESLLISY